MSSNQVESELKAYRPSKEDFFRNNRLFWIVVLFAIATILSVAKPVVLPDGGAVTYFSLLFLWLITFFYGPKCGFGVGVLFGFAKLFVTYVTGETINYNPGALFLEYPLACGVVAAGYLVVNKFSLKHGTVDDECIKHDTVGLCCGYLIGVFCMGVCYVIAAMLFYPPEFPLFFENLVYCITYDMSYLLFEAVLTLVILAIPQIRQVIFFLRHVATTPAIDPTLRSF